MHPHRSPSAQCATYMVITDASGHGSLPCAFGDNLEKIDGPRFDHMAAENRSTMEAAWDTKSSASVGRVQNDFDFFLGVVALDLDRHFVTDAAQV